MSQYRILDYPFFTFICCKIVMMFNKTQSKQKEAENGPLKKVVNTWTVTGWLINLSLQSEGNNVSSYRWHLYEMILNWLWWMIELKFKNKQWQNPNQTLGTTVGIKKVRRKLKNDDVNGEKFALTICLQEKCYMDRFVER